MDNDCCRPKYVHRTKRKDVNYERFESEKFQRLFLWTKVKDQTRIEDDSLALDFPRPQHTSWRREWESIDPALHEWPLGNHGSSVDSHKHKQEENNRICGELELSWPYQFVIHDLP